MAGEAGSTENNKRTHLNPSSSTAEESFLRACRDCDFHRVEKLVLEGSLTAKTINARDEKGYSGLMTVVGFPKYDLDIVKLLLAQPDLDVNLASYHGGNTALMIATVYGRHEVIKCLLDRTDIRTNIVNDEGETAMDIAKKQDKNLILGLFKEKVGKEGKSTRTVEEYKEGYFHSMTFQNLTKPTTVCSEVTPAKENTIDTCSSRHMGPSSQAFRTFSDMKQAMQEQWTSQICNNIDQISVAISEKHLHLDHKLTALQSNCDSEIQKIQEETDAEKKKVEHKYRIEIQVLTNKLDSLRGELEKAKTCCQDAQMNTMRSEFECRICGIEMAPPMMIYQCVDGHPVCMKCRHSPEITKCPDCRGHLAGRSLTLEKIARTIF